MTKRTIFYCATNSPVVFTIEETGKVTHKNSQVLTITTQLQPAGICSILTAAANGIPQPCKFEQTPWLNFDLKNKSESGNLLTSESCCMCSVGGMIKVRAANAMGFKKGSVSVDSASSAEKVEVAETSSEKKSVPRSITNTPVDSKNASKEDITAKPSETRQEINQPPQKTKAESKPLSDDKKFTLQCKSCERKGCKYRREKFGEFATEVNNDSVILRTNYKKFLGEGKNLTAADRNYLESLKMGGAWSYAAHHVISGNQVFKQVPKVTKIAQACGYDINCAENCIMLPSKSEGHGELTAIGKSASAFDVMSMTGMQWHVGGHSYKFSADELEEIKRRTGRGNKVKSYAELLIEDLQKISNRIGDDVCPAKVISTLNNLSLRVKEKLASFKKIPQKVFPTTFRANLTCLPSRHPI